MSSGRELWYLSRGTGFVTLILLTATVVLGIVDQQRWSSRAWPRFVLDKLHRNLSLLVLCVLGIHVATVVMDSFVPIRLVDAIVPFRSGYRPLWVGLGALALDMLLAIAITSGLRRHLGHRAWRAVHWLAYAAWPVALVHSFGTGTGLRLRVDARDLGDLCRGRDGGALDAPRRDRGRRARARCDGVTVTLTAQTPMISTRRLTAGPATTLSEHLALHGTLPDITGEALIDAVADAGLRGRGGAAFPTARKMRAVAASESPRDRARERGGGRADERQGQQAARKRAASGARRRAARSSRRARRRGRARHPRELGACVGGGRASDRRAQRRRNRRLPWFTSWRRRRPIWRARRARSCGS